LVGVGWLRHLIYKTREPYIATKDKCRKRDSRRARETNNCLIGAALESSVVPARPRMTNDVNNSTKGVHRKWHGHNTNGVTTATTQKAEIARICPEQFWTNS
jgi:hypothetical protein